ncbi:RING-H2 finger protein ATL79 [Acorus calamus]|uniref:RING-H2 finger protein ATL79 n=1 Tax=Acorus calamus TaxID=4465 RepID=A0AAV9DRS0_ACOCL|nr:RING-H2 finger protein ATL79 [Acorus calamus]
MASPNTTTTTTPTKSKSNWSPYIDPKDFDTNLAMILIALISAILCALALNFAFRFFLRLYHRQRISTTDLEKQMTASSLPALVFSASGKAGLAGEEGVCAICLSEFVEGEEVRVLPSCRHGFHGRCVEGWLSKRASCPTCRAVCELGKDSVAGDGSERAVEEA